MMAVVVMCLLDDAFAALYLVAKSSLLKQALILNIMWAKEPAI